MVVLSFIVRIGGIIFYTIKKKKKRKKTFFENLTCEIQNIVIQKSFYDL